MPPSTAYTEKKHTPKEILSLCHKCLWTKPLLLQYLQSLIQIGLADPFLLKKLNISAKSANISHRYGIQIEKPSREREFEKIKYHDSVVVSFALAHAPTLSLSVQHELHNLLSKRWIRADESQGHYIHSCNP
jgi:hypothetical protein